MQAKTHNVTLIMSTNRWEFGTLTIDGMNITWNAKIFDDGSIFGIKNGRISKLCAKIGDEWIFNYDRGWDIKPQGTIAKKAFKMLVKQYN